MANEKVLIVDDEVIFTEALGLNLESAGYQVVGKVPRADLALDVLEKHQVDLILVDISLKGPMNGIELGREIQRKHEIPFVFITAYSEKDIIEEARNSGGYAYIVKPIDINQLKISIEMALHKSKEERVKAQQRLEVERHFYEMADSLPIALIELNCSYQATYYNYLAKMKFGLDSVGQFEFFTILRQEDRRGSMELLEKAKQGEKITFNHFLILLKDGRKVPATISCSPIYREGVIIGIRIVIIDIHEFVSTFIFPDETFMKDYEFSERERNVLLGLIRFKSNQDIADQNYISLPTVKYHIRNIYNKLGVNNRKELLKILQDYYMKRFGNEYYALYLLNVLIQE